MITHRGPTKNVHRVTDQSRIEHSNNCIVKLKAPKEMGIGGPKTTLVTAVQKLILDHVHKKK